MTPHEAFLATLILLFLAAVYIRLRIHLQRRIASVLDADDLDTIRMDELYDEATAAHPKLVPSRALDRLYRQYDTTLRLSRVGFGDPTYRSIRRMIVRDRILIARRWAMEYRKEFEEEFAGISMPGTAQISQIN